MSDLIQQTRILLIGGPANWAEAQMGDLGVVSRIGCDMPSLLGAPPLYDYHHVIFWPDSSFLSVGSRESWLSARDSAEGTGFTVPCPEFWELGASQAADGGFRNINWRAGDQRAQPAMFCAREDRLMNHIATNADARELTHMLELRCFQRMHELIHGAAAGAVNVLIVTAEARRSMAWISPLISVQPEEDCVVTENLAACSDQLGAVDVVRRIANQAVGQWTVTLGLRVVHADEGTHALDTVSTHAPPPHVRLDWQDLLRSTESADERGSEEDARLLFNAQYFAQNDALCQPLTLIKSHLNRRQDAKSLLLITGRGALFAMPEPTSLAELCRALVQQAVLEIAPDKTAIVTNADVDAPQVEERPGGDAGRQDSRAFPAATHARELEVFCTVLRSKLPATISRSGGAGRDIKPEDVNKVCESLCMARTRTELCRAHFGVTDYHGEKLDALMKKLREVWSKHDDLKDFSQCALKRIHGLPK